MGDKRSIGITIFAWIIIASSLFNLFLRLEYLFRVAFRSGQIGIGTYFSLVISVLSIISAAYLLKLKKWARLATIIISIIVLIDIVLKIPFFVKSIGFSPMLIIILLIVSFPLIFGLGVIYYFSRPAVRGQFS